MMWPLKSKRPNSEPHITCTEFSSDDTPELRAEKLFHVIGIMNPDSYNLADGAAKVLEIYRDLDIEACERLAHGK